MSKQLSIDDTCIYAVIKLYKNAIDDLQQIEDIKNNIIPSNIHLWSVLLYFDTYFDLQYQPIINQIIEKAPLIN